MQTPVPVTRKGLIRSALTVNLALFRNGHARSDYNGPHRCHRASVATRLQPHPIDDELFEGDETVTFPWRLEQGMPRTQIPLWHCYDDDILRRALF